MNMKTKTTLHRLTHAFRFIAAVAMLTLSADMVHAQDDYDLLIENEKWYADHCSSVIEQFESTRSNASKHPQKYCLLRTQQASPLDFAMVVSTTDKSEMVMLTPNGNTVKAKRVSKSMVPDSVYWESISQLGQRKTHSKDITLRERPLPVRAMNKAKNIFSVVVEGEEKIADIGAYNQMIFKPHQNAVRLSKQERDLQKDEDGTVVTDEMEYTFKLNDPAIVTKMFRGYDDEEACPWVVKSSFFKNHSLLQYSRWKQGEPVKKASRDVCRMISDYYGGREIVDSRWLASIETAERSLYAVQFAIAGTEALAAMVCIAEGEVVCSWEFQGTVDGSYESGQSIWFVDDEGNFMEHAPEIHCAVATDEGLELYIRLFGGESVQYYILREMGTVWMEMMVDYWIYAF